MLSCLGLATINNCKSNVVITMSTQGCAEVVIKYSFVTTLSQHCQKQSTFLGCTVDTIM